MVLFPPFLFIAYFFFFKSSGTHITLPSVLQESAQQTHISKYHSWMEADTSTHCIKHSCSYSLSESKS